MLMATRNKSCDINSTSIVFDITCIIGKLESLYSGPDLNLRHQECNRTDTSFDMKCDKLSVTL